MNGIHDMGGMHGFGRVERDHDESSPFHAAWERRVFGIVRSVPGGNLDSGRHGLELLDPVSYLENGYFGRWLAALENGLFDLGVITAAELEARIHDPVTIEPPESGAGWSPPEDRGYIRPVDRAPVFAEGDEVRTRNHQPSGHTRLPAYARQRLGVIERVHPAMVYPDDNAHDRGENPQFLYTVRFSGEELWGAEAESGTDVRIDLFEPYLEVA